MGKIQRQLVLSLLLFLFTLTIYIIVISVNKRQVPLTRALPVVRCRLKDIDTFSTEVMTYDRKPEQLECPSLGVYVSVSMGTLSVFSNDVDAVYAREIKPNSQFGEPMKLRGTADDVISKDESGAVMNVITGLCVAPLEYHKGAMLSIIPLVFTKDCKSFQNRFHFTKEGFVKHIDTGRCWAPKPGAWIRNSRIPPKNTPLVLIGRCSWRFDVIRGGLLHLRGASCVHNLGGWGKPPVDGQRLGLFPTCSAQDRLKYRW